MEPRQRLSSAALLLITYFLSCSEGFSPLLGKHQVTVWPSRQPSALTGALIEPDTTEVEYDDGRGGVQLARESVIQIKGKLTDECEFSELVRFTKLTKLEESSVASSIIFTGSGVEYYQDPETIEGSDAEVRYAPLEAVKAALNGGQINADANKDHISINFAGGSDAIVIEVMDAAEELTRILREEKVITPSATVDFRSISDDTFPEGSSCVTVVSVARKLSSVEDVDSAKEPDSVAAGEVYRSQADGTYYTLLEKDINTAVE